jgi:hypothetical protein
MPHRSCLGLLTARTATTGDGDTNWTLLMKMVLRAAPKPGPCYRPEPWVCLTDVPRAPRDAFSVLVEYTDGALLLEPAILTMFVRWANNAQPIAHQRQWPASDVDIRLPHLIQKFHWLPGDLWTTSSVAAIVENLSRASLEERRTAGVRRSCREGGPPIGVQCDDQCPGHPIR